eukprot:gb/GFBE01015744.1/.p1 GENE.gb/GFBE01015744.1/~~gb/GFBE01015744.1/.p1  ORF type:complete len:359 (+),score=88.09 gb/GFBE01015744.1/:1-1077(+)
MSHLPLALRMMAQAKKSEEPAAPPAKRARTEDPIDPMAQMMAQMAMMAQMQAAMGIDITGSTGSSTGSTARPQMTAPSMQQGSGTMGAMPSMQGMQSSMGGMMGGQASMAGMRGYQASMGGMARQPAIPGRLGSQAPGVMSAPSTAASSTAGVVPQAAKPHRSPADVKVALQAYGCVVKDSTARENLLQLQEIESHLRRAEVTKKNLSRSPNQAMVSGFRDGYTPGPEGLLKMLEAGADPDTPSEGFASGFMKGMTPLLAAASWGKVDEMRILKAAGANLHAKTPNFGHSLLHVVAGGNVESWGTEKTHAMLRLILDWDPEFLTIKNEQGKTAADWAKHEKKRQSAAFLTNYALTGGK